MWLYYLLISPCFSYFLVTCNSNVMWWGISDIFFFLSYFFFLLEPLRYSRLPVLPSSSPSASPSPLRMVSAGNANFSRSLNVALLSALETSSQDDCVKTDTVSCGEPFHSCWTVFIYFPVRVCLSVCMFVCLFVGMYVFVDPKNWATSCSESFYLVLIQAK